MSRLSITAKLFPPNRASYSDSDPEPSALYRELLLSYRLLFGQSSKSRKLLDQLCASTPPESTDPLIKVCASPVSSKWDIRRFAGRRRPQSFPNNIFPISALDLNGQIQDSDTYSALDDFPYFGQRLILLQRYNMRQQPSRVKDIWRDRRNPLQWYTFWTVLWVGGAGILLAILQLVVGLVQLYYAIPRGTHM